MSLSDSEIVNKLCYIFMEKYVNRLTSSVYFIV
jgi:hypothetical protein